MNADTQKQGNPDSRGLPNPDFHNPPKNCAICPRLAEYRAQNRQALPHGYNAPVPSFGPLHAELLILGLAPGRMGANYTGRPFTGDYAGEWLYKALLEFGWAKGRFESRADDGLELINCRIANAVRCVPPENKPTGPEINACNAFLREELANMPRLATVLTLGGVAHRAVLKALGARQSAYQFGHGHVHELGKLKIVNSYHCSRYNTQTGRLKWKDFQAVFRNFTI